MTSGGSESLLMMMKAYRDFARNERGIKKPEIVASKTFHAAIKKGGDLFGIKVILVSVLKAWKCSSDNNHTVLKVRT